MKNNAQILLLCAKNIDFSMIHIAIFASGNGSNAENIVNYFAQNSNIQVSIIISNKKDAFVHERAKKFGIPSFTFSKEEFQTGDLILSKMVDYEIDFIVLAGFLLKVPNSIMNAYPGRIINIHPALLPKFGGKGMYGGYVHQAVKDANETETGITIHYINENYDEGDVIFQAKCSVLSSDTPDDIAHKVQSLEQRHFPEIIESLVKKINKK